MKLAKSMTLGLACVAITGVVYAQEYEPPPMDLFITSVGLGHGAELDGLKVAFSVECDLVC